MNRETITSSVVKFIKSLILADSDLEYTVSDHIIISRKNHVNKENYLVEVNLEILIDYFRLAVDEKYVELIDGLDEQIMSISKYLGFDNFEVYPHFEYKYKNVNPYYDRLSNAMKKFEKNFKEKYPSNDYDSYGFELELKLPNEGSPDFGLVFITRDLPSYGFANRIEKMIYEVVEEDKVLSRLADYYDFDFVY